MSDLRTRLEAIATGKATPAAAGEINPPEVIASQPAFLAWSRFSAGVDGEPLAAPAESLAPLP